jgi:hypothetical protein
MADKAIPSYEVEFIPLERRLNDRRINPEAGLPPGVQQDRRKGSRREKAEKDKAPDNKPK